MAVASSEGSPITTPTSVNYENNRSFSRSPSLSSIREFQWPTYFVSQQNRKGKNVKMDKGKFCNIFDKKQMTNDSYQNQLIGCVKLFISVIFLLLCSWIVFSLSLKYFILSLIMKCPLRIIDGSADI